MNGKPSFSEKDADYYNRFMEGYSPYSDRDLEMMLKPLDDMVLRFDRPRICEIGSASGQFSQHLARRYGKERLTLYGLDIAAGVLAVYPYHRICGSAFALPIRDEAVDMVCLPAALHHLFPLEASLPELSRILKKGGILYCLEPNLHHPQRFFFMRFQAMYNLYRNTNDVPVHAGALKNVLKSYGMSVAGFQYVSLEFAKPSILQKIQNRLASIVRRESLKKYTLPWFILMARKG